jgi:integrase/recombinase XerD
MEASTAVIFIRNCQLHLQHMKLKGPQPKTIDAYPRVCFPRQTRAIRRIGARFDQHIDSLTE